MRKNFKWLQVLLENERIAKKILKKKNRLDITDIWTHYKGTVIKVEAFKNQQSDQIKEVS